MAENAVLQRKSPLGRYTDRLAACPLDLAEEPFVRHLVLRLDATSTAVVDVERLLGLTLPPANRASGADGSRTAVWLGPDEWLIMDSGPDDDLAAELAGIVRPADGAVVDVSAQRTTLRLRGPYARSVLAKGCSVDLHPRVVVPGLAVQTMIAHAAVILVALDAGCPDQGLAADLDCRILVRSTFAAYLADWLLDAAIEYA